MWIFTWLADKWTKQKHRTEDILHEFADDHDNSWWAVAVAGSVQTAMNLGDGFIDTLRIGDGVKEGGAKGYLQDGLRLLTIAGPAAKMGGRVARYFVPNASGEICGWISGVQALRQTGTKHFAVLEDLVKAAGHQPDLIYLEDLAPILQKLGALTKPLLAFTVDEINTFGESTSTRRRDVKRKLVF